MHADAGKVMNPMQCRGQVEGGIAQALGATLFENVRLNDRGEVTTAAFRQYRLPQYADIPRTEVHFMETVDTIGPLGAKSMSENPFNPVAPAFANALRDATGILHPAAPHQGPRLARPGRTGPRPVRPTGRPVTGGCGRNTRYRSSRFTNARLLADIASYPRFRGAAAGHTF